MSSDPIDVSVAQDGGIMKTITQEAPEGMCESDFNKNNYICFISYAQHFTIAYFI